MKSSRKGGCGRGASFLLAATCALVFRCMIPAWAQFNEERRRGDLSPLALPGGSTVEFKTLDSAALGTTEPYSIFLPPSFNKEPTRTYPVVYFLHGLNNDQTSWTVERYGHLQNRIEDMILAGKVPEFIMVHPWGNNSFYCNYADGSKRYEDLITQELESLMETQYRARKGRENRAIGGTSMGGYGALKIAMKYPDRFASAVGNSPIIFLGRNPILDVPEEMKTSRYYQFFVNILKPIFGDPFRQDLWDANNPLLLARSGKLGHLHILFDYGTDDRYISTIHIDEGIKALDRALTEAMVSHTFKIYPGEPHGWALVAAHLDETLPFLCQTFK
ncbi:MAG TPA: alpha/beta hydrolase family protein [Acidobacteriota bacterium]|nr:alpha/beta hydrolase family protein [Acidobacteriota bacterium]